MPDVIPLNDLMRANAPIRSELDREIGRVLDSGWFLRGRQVESFEEEWADYCGQKFCITCNSGTDALTLAAAALDISETSVQSNTSALTPIGLHRGGARIRIVDVLDDGRTGPELKNAVPVLLFGRAPSAAEAAIAFSTQHMPMAGVHSRTQQHAGVSIRPRLWAAWATVGPSRPMIQRQPA